MKVLVTGYAGQLGWDIIRELENRGIPCRGNTSCPDQLSRAIEAYEQEVQ